MAERLASKSSSTAAALAAFETWPEISRIEIDRFCHNCGYNLHQQDVRCEPRTEVLMCRCPECGTFHPVAVPSASFSNWAQRFKGLLMLHWIAVVLCLGFFVGMFHGVSIYFTLDEFTGYFDSQAGTYVMDFRMFYWEHPEMWALVCGISGGCSFGLAFVGTTLAVVFMPHWRRAAHIAVILVWAIVPAIIVALGFWSEIPKSGPVLASDMLQWATTYILAYVGCYILGGALALWIGRRLVRLVIRIVVPPRWRVCLEAIRPQ